jgi:predicted metallo-beta-lactamase superfamily hydrolase
MRKREEVHINESKMKRAKEFFREFEESPVKQERGESHSYNESSVTKTMTTESMNEIGENR